MSNLNQKTFVLDTNVLLASPYSIYNFDEHHVILTDVTLSELDQIKTKPGEVGYNAREVLRLLEELRQKGNYRNGIPLESGGDIRIECCRQDRKAETADEKILAVCEALHRQGINPVLVSNDINMRIRAQLKDIAAEEYKTDQVAQPASFYTGRKELLVPGEAIDRFYRERGIPCSDIAEYSEDAFYPNEFLVMKDLCNPSHSAIAKVRKDAIVPLQFANSHPWDVTPKNVGQRFALEALMDDSISLVLLIGPAGTGKTFLNLAAGLENTIDQRKYSKLLIFRPLVYFDEGLGYLPGSETEKIDPLLRGYYDNLNILTSLKDQPTKNYMQSLFDQKVIEAQAMSYLRSRSIPNTWLSLDEAQNITITQAFGVVSRAGGGTKIILSGDPDQIDNPSLDQRTNGLRFTAERMKASELCAQVSFSESECVRSPLAQEAIRRMSPKGYR